ncbi:MAG: hypothetical protein ACTHWO_10195 [Nesterenkonia sp.]
MSLVMAHRQGLVTIPTLADRSLSVPERLDWLAECGLGTVSRGDWDNARRPERQAQILPLAELEPYLERMCSMAAEEHLLMLRQVLGVNLAEAVGADTSELVEALGRVLMDEQMQQQLRRQIAQDARTAQSSQTAS